MASELEIFYQEIADSIVNLEDEKAIDLANQAILNDFDLVLVIEKGFATGLRRVGDLFDDLYILWLADWLAEHEEWLLDVNDSLDNLTTEIELIHDELDLIWIEIE